MPKEIITEDWVNTPEGKAGEALLDKALKVYGVNKSLLCSDNRKDENGQPLLKPSERIEWYYYPTGRRKEPAIPVFRVTNPAFDPRTKEGRKQPRTLEVLKPLVCFVTVGGQKRYYYEGFEKTSDFEKYKMSDEQKDGIVRKATKYLDQ